MSLKVCFLAFAVVLSSGCVESATDQPSASPEALAQLAARMALLDEAVDAWADAATIDEVHRWAETAVNLVVGPEGPGYGDIDGDGTVSGDNDSGILPGLVGVPEGLAVPVRANVCVERDILGSDWSDPEAEWQTMTDAIEAWEPGNNTMPSLPSHAMRVVGWATFTLGDRVG